MCEQARIDEFCRRFVAAGRQPGNPHEGIDVPTVRGIVRDVWGDDLRIFGQVPQIEVDATIVTLARQGVVGLHEHDFPRSVSDQSTLLWAGGRAYCLVCLGREYRR